MPRSCLKNCCLARKKKEDKTKNSKTLNKKSLVDFSSVEEDLFRVEKTDKKHNT